MPKILIMTSVFGGGHVFRDVAIAEELKKALPSDFEIIFASGGNAYEMLKAEGLQVEEIPGMNIPAHMGKVHFFRCYLAALWSEFLQVFYLRNMIKKYHPCLIVLDEYFFLTDYCRFRKVPVVFICDFLGIPQYSILRNPLRSLMEKLFDWLIINWQARRTERWIFTGDIDQVPREDWRKRAHDLGIVMVEPITKLQYTSLPEQKDARRNLGFNENEKVITVAVGCAGVGEYLLNAANAAASLLSDRVSDLRIELICGKGIDSDPLRRIAGPGVRIHDYVRNFQEFIAASDAAVIQSGFTTTVEYLMAGVPIVVVPLANHWEQATTARYVAKKFDVKTIDALQVSPEVLAEAMLELLSQSRREKSPFRGDGHILAARAIANVLKVKFPCKT